MSLTLEMPKAKAPKKKSKKIIGLFLLLIALIIAFFVWIFSGRIVSESGELSAGFVPVPAPMSSALAEVLVEPNTYVQTGQLLAKLEAGDYIKQMSAAKALVQGTIDTNQLTAERVAAAQKAAEEMVERIALARHEENSRKDLVEKRSIEHAKALLAMRDADAKGESEAKKDAAKKAEAVAKQNLDNAKISFEHASQSRSAIEAELHKIRNSNATTGQIPPTIEILDPTLVKAPINGYLTQNIPLAGQKINMGEAVFQIIPEVGAKLFAVAKLSNEEANMLETNNICFVLPEKSWRILSGNVVSIATKEQSDISINLKDEIDVGSFGAENSARSVFWVHPLANNSMLKPLFLVLSYLPI